MGMVGKRYSFIIAVMAMVALLLAVPQVSAALTVEVSQSGADSGEVMKGQMFTVTASGWSGTCSQATISFSGCSSCSLSGEETQKTIGQGQSVSWTTVVASQKSTDETISASVSGGGDCSGSGTSSSFDIALPPSLTLDATTDDSSVSKGSTFDINIEVTNDGETTAQDLTIDPTTSGFTSDCSSISSLDEEQSAAQSCSVTAASSLVGGSKTVTLEVSSTNADSATDTVSITVNAAAGDGICDPGEAEASDCDSGDGGGSSGGGAAGGITVQNRTNIPVLVPGVGLRNNTRLQAAIEKVLAMGKMSEQAKENLLRLSQSITSNISSIQEFKIESGNSRIQNKIRCRGQQRVRSLMIFDSVPKTFASNASMVTVSAPGGTVEIAEEDPSWVILFPEVNPDDELIITYEVTGQKSTTVLDGMVTEVYAESLEELAAPEEGVPGEEAGETPTTPEGEAQPPFALDATMMMILGGIAAAVVIIVVLVLVLKSRKKSSSKPVTALNAVESNFGK